MLILCNFFLTNDSPGHLPASIPGARGVWHLVSRSRHKRACPHVRRHIRVAISREANTSPAPRRELRSIKCGAGASPYFAAANSRPGAHCRTWGRSSCSASKSSAAHTLRSRIFRRHACAGCAAQVARPHVLRIHVLRSKGIFPGQSLEGTVPIVIIHFSHLKNYQIYHRFSR